jgi:hypothetical protein
MWYEFEDTPPSILGIVRGKSSSRAPSAQVSHQLTFCDNTS